MAIVRELAASTVAVWVETESDDDLKIGQKFEKDGQTFEVIFKRPGKNEFKLRLINE